MNLLIRPDAAGTWAEVTVTVAKSAYGGGHLLRPGESYQDIPHEVWRRYADQTVDVLALRASLRGVAPPPAPIVAGEVADPIARRKLFGQAPTLTSAILVNGILMFGVPAAVLGALLREAGPGFDMDRFVSVLATKLLVGIVITGPLVGALIWHVQNRKPRSK